VLTPVACTEAMGAAGEAVRHALSGKVLRQKKQDTTANRGNEILLLRAHSLFAPAYALRASAGPTKPWRSRTLPSQQGLISLLGGREGRGSRFVVLAFEKLGLHAVIDISPRKAVPGRALGIDIGVEIEPRLFHGALHIRFAASYTD